jgi:hypothetical protein
VRVLRYFVCQQLYENLPLRLGVRLTEALFIEGNVFAMDEFFHERSPD